MRAEQCKCWPGFRREAGACRARAVYAFPQPAGCAATPCAVPARAAVTDARTCAWACAAGAYLAPSAGFEDACQPCVGLPPGHAFATAGDDGAPASCEFVVSRR